MSGYVEAGYLVVVVGLGGYAVSLVARERSARRRLSPRRGLHKDTTEPVEKR
jgi:hypothetical protein